MRSILFWLFFVMGIAFSFAQMDVPVVSTADRFSLELTNLKASADTLNQGNETLAYKNNQLRLSLNQTQEQLQRLSDANDLLTREILKLQGTNASRASKIARMEKDIFDIESKMEHVSAAMKPDEDELVKLQAEDALLTRQIVSLGGSARDSLGQGEDVLSANRAKEKLRLLKMIDASKQRQEIITRQSANNNKLIPVSVVTIETTGDKRKLISQIKQLEEEISQLHHISNPPALTDQWDAKELRQLDIEVKKLQRNHDELEGLVSRMEEKVQKRTLTKDQVQEQRRLQSSLNAVVHENMALRQNLAILREQMVVLDKRKAYLEAIRRN